jgi:Flagellar hook-length control protein FliK
MSSTRKSFSSVLQRVPTAVGRSISSEADDVRSVKHAEDGPQSKETRGLNASPKTEQSDVSPSRTEERSRSSDDGEKIAEGSKTDDEFATVGSDVHSEVQVQVPAPILSMSSSQPVPEVIDQAEVSSKGEQRSSDDETGLLAGLSKPSLVSYATVDSHAAVSLSRETHAYPNGECAPPSYGQTQQQSVTPVIQARTDPQADQSGKPGPDAVVDGRGAEAPKRIETSSVPMQSQSGVVPPPLDPMTHQAFRAYLGGMAVNGKPEVSTTEAIEQEKAPLDHLNPAPAEWYGQTLNDQADIGAKSRSIVQNGQQPNSDTAAHFSELWPDEHRREQGSADTKLPQEAPVDLHGVNGRGMEPLIVGAPAQTVAAPTAPTSSLTTQASPGIRVDDSAQPPVNSPMRSVVIDVARPDLGHVNIRVAMTHEFVHTHLSADRAEVGQFLINGHDRLQAALQASGMEMGQFRVDIDRQSAGRSFQHGPSQEQGQSWNQGSQWTERGQGQSQQDNRCQPLQGLLNLVA